MNHHPSAMQFHASNGTSFKLAIVGYEFPKNAHEPYDSNWLIIHIEATTPQRSWQAQSPCLLTYEVERLTTWFEKIANGTSSNQTCGFLEPCLKFDLSQQTAEQCLLRIMFDLEMRPDWPLKRGQARDDCWIEILVGYHQLIGAAQSLRRQLQRYPQRADR